MKRTQLITLLLVLFTGMGVASAKPKVAVLGLEVLDKTNAKASIDAARQLTEGLRLAAKTSGPYEIADNSQREFLDEKIINQCESEARDCLLKIASNFGASSLVYGKLQLTDNKKNFQVTVFLLNSGGGAAKPAISSVPVSASTQDLQTAGKKIYNELVGVVSVGSIAIKAKTSRGSVYINGDLRGQLVDGEFKATQLADGEYKVRITADGFKKWEETIKVKAGQVSTVEPDLQAEAKAPVDDPEDKGSRPVTGGNGTGDKFKLEERENTVSHSSGGRTGWKVVAIGGAVAAVGGLAFDAYSFTKRQDELDKISDVGYKGGGSGFFGSTCNALNAKGDALTGSDLDHFNKSCDQTRNMWIGGTIAGVGAIAAAVGFYMGYVRSEETDSHFTASVKRARKPRFAVTPVMSPNGGGATMRIDF